MKRAYLDETLRYWLFWVCGVPYGFSVKNKKGV